MHSRESVLHPARSNSTVLSMLSQLLRWPPCAFNWGNMLYIMHGLWPLPVRLCTLLVGQFGVALYLQMVLSLVHFALGMHQRYMRCDIRGTLDVSHICKDCRVLCGVLVARMVLHKDFGLLLRCSSREILSCDILPSWRSWTWTISCCFPDMF